MPPRNALSEERRGQILDAAAAVFVRRGFHVARMDDIAAQAGVSKGTLYWYFESKDDLIHSLLDRMITQELAQAETVLVMDIPAKEKLERLLDRVISDIIHMKPLMPILFEFFSLMMRRNQVRQVLGKYYQGYLEALIPVIEGGIERGEFKSVNPQEVAIAISAIIEGTIFLWAALPEVVDLEHHIRKGTWAVVQGIEADA
jgi:TetR/AcrR family fatty acid metabolism transcriptional regulator